MHLFVDSLEARRLMSVAGSTLLVTQTSLVNGTFATFRDGATSAVNLDDGKGGSVKGVQLGGIKVSHTGTLFITGTGKADQIDLTISRGKLAFNPYYAISPVTGNVVRQPDGSFVFHTTGGVNGIQVVTGPRTGQAIKRVVVAGLGGDDTITIHSDVPVDVRGGTGNDRITVSAPTHAVSGGSGEDKIAYGLSVKTVRGSTAPGTVRVDKDGRVIFNVDSVIP